MAEKINGQGFGSIDSTSSSRRPAQAETTSQGRSVESDSSASSADTVSLTSSSQLLQRLEELLRTAPPDDVQRIAALKEAVESGAYRIDARAIADRLLRLERDLQ
jgi:negative regulator of flagellin synthesis FlgM